MWGTMTEGASDRWASEKEFLIHVEKELARLRAWTSSMNWVNTEAWNEVLRAVHNLRGTAAMVGHPIISEIFDGLEKKLEHASDYTESQLRDEVDFALTQATDALRGPVPHAPGPVQPVSVSTPRTPALNFSTLKQLKPLRVVLLDDDAVFRSHMGTVFQRSGMTVFELESGSDLTPEYLQRQKIDVLILDLNLPLEDGYSICKRIKASAAGYNVPIVFVSADGKLESRLFGWQAGGEDFIVKPVDPLELLLRVEFLVETAALRRKQQLKVGVDYDVFLRELERLIKDAVSGKKSLVLATLSLTSVGADQKKRATGVKHLLDHLRRGDALCSPAAGYLMILQPDMTLASAQRNFDSLTARLNQDYSLECRVGLAQSPSHGKSSADLLAASKECLDRALQGGAGWSVITPDSRVAQEPRQPHLVVVDDDDAFLNYLGKHFAELGLNAMLVSSSQRAVELVRKLKPDLVTLDILMPDPDGLKVLETLKRDPDLAEIPVIMVSGKGEEEYLVRAFELGAADYLVKPVRLPELNARVRKALRETRARLSGSQPAGANEAHPA
jgi:DNA-binding response OmpR family regulator